MPAWRQLPRASCVLQPVSSGIYANVGVITPWLASDVKRQFACPGILRHLGSVTTIKDLARVVGVSYSTVARALNDHPAISAALKVRVRDAAREHGYIADSAARALRVRSSALIGFVVPDIEGNDMATMAKALAECCNATGRQLVVSCSEDDPARELAHVQALVGAQAAALVLVPSVAPLAQTAILAQRMPALQLVRQVPQLGNDAFVFDDTQGIREATAHLLSLGHRRIGYVGGSETISTGARRLAGYQLALHEAGLAANPRLLITVLPHGPDASGAFRRLYDAEHPSAIVLGGPRITIGAMEAISDLGLVVPRDLSVVGFGDRPWMRWWHSGLTTVSLPARDLALACGRHLSAVLRGTATAGAAAMLAPSLVHRGSTVEHICPSRGRSSRHA
jgi:LacI family transcriptional regulator